MLWRQISRMHSSSHSFDALDLPMLILSILLMPINWWFEWRKWELINASNNSSIGIKWQGFLAGVVTSLLTPGMLGNFIGRSYFYDKRKRPEMVFLSLMGNLSQFIVSLFFGVMALWILKKSPFQLPFNSIFIPAVVILVCGALLFFFGGKLWQVILGFFFSLRPNISSSNFIFPFLILSLSRHILFTIQLSFGANLSPTIVLWIWQVYLFVTLIPSVFLGKVIIRETVAVFVLSQVTIGLDSIGIFTASFTVWVINLFIPLIIALLLLRRKSYVE